MQARANLLDSMLASSSSSDHTTSSDDDDTIAERQHLHNLHRFRRRKKRGLPDELTMNKIVCFHVSSVAHVFSPTLFAGESDKEQVIRYIPLVRPSIMNNPDFFFRYGVKEQEAVSYFDFLDEMSTSTPSSGDIEEHEHEDLQYMNLRQTSYQCYKDSESSDSESVSIDEDKLLSPIAEECCELEGCRAENCVIDDPMFTSFLQSSQEYEVNRISFSDSCAESFSSSDHSFTHFE